MCNLLEFEIIMLFFWMLIGRLKVINDDVIYINRHIYKPGSISTGFEGGMNTALHNVHLLLLHNDI